MSTIRPEGRCVACGQMRGLDGRGAITFHEELTMGAPDRMLDQCPGTGILADRDWSAIRSEMDRAYAQQREAQAALKELTSLLVAKASADRWRAGGRLGWPAWRAGSG